MPDICASLLATDLPITEAGYYFLISLVMSYRAIFAFACFRDMFYAPGITLRATCFAHFRQAARPPCRAQIRMLPRARPGDILGLYANFWHFSSRLPG